MTRRLFPGTPAFALRGAAGEQALLGALGQPRWPHYRALQDKAAALHYFLNRNHPFVDGNKRFAVAAMEMFLFVNQAELVATDEEVEAFALGVAKGDMDRPTSAAFLHRRAIRLSWDDDQAGRWLRRMPAEEITIVREILSSWADPAMVRSVRIASALAQERAASISTGDSTPEGDT